MVNNFFCSNTVRRTTNPVCRGLLVLWPKLWQSFCHFSLKGFASNFEWHFLHERKLIVKNETHLSWFVANQKNKTCFKYVSRLFRVSSYRKDILKLEEDAQKILNFMASYGLIANPKKTALIFLKLRNGKEGSVEVKIIDVINYYYYFYLY